MSSNKLKLKDAYYFPHYVGARDDRKIKRVRKDLGIEGYGIFFMTLEKLREESSLKYPMHDVDLLADDFGTSEAKLKTVICNYELFKIEKGENGEVFFSPRQMQYLEPFFEKKERARLAGIKSGEVRRKKQIEDIKRLSQTNSSEHLLNECSTNDEQLINKVIKKIEKDIAIFSNLEKQNLTAQAITKIDLDNLGLSQLSKEYLKNNKLSEVINFSIDNKEYLFQQLFKIHKGQK